MRIEIYLLDQVKTARRFKIYPNFSGKKNNNKLNVIKEIENKINIYIKLTPEIKTVEIQLPINNID